MLSCGEEDGDEHGADGTDDGVEECREGERVVRALEFLDGLVEVDDGVEEGEDLGVEGGDVAHRPVVGVEGGEDVVHPGGVDEGPGHKGEEGDVEGAGAERVDVLGQDREGAGDPEDRQWLTGETVDDLCEREDTAIGDNVH